MIPRLRQLLKSWLLPLLVFGGLYLTGLHTPIVALLQRAVLATGLLRPDTDITLPSSGSEITTSDNLDFRMTDPSGHTLDARDLSGRVVFLNLWATWCPPCLAELPNIASLYTDYADDKRVAFVLLNVEDDFEKGKDYIEQKGYDLPIYHLEGGLPRTMKVEALPTTLVIAAGGEIVLTHNGMAQYDTKSFRALLDRLSGPFNDADHGQVLTRIDRGRSDDQQ